MLKPTECQVARYIRAGYTHWVSYITELELGYFVDAGFPTTEDAVEIHLQKIGTGAKAYALKEIYE